MRPGFLDIPSSEYQALQHRIGLTNRPALDMQDDHVRRIAVGLSVDSQARAHFIADPAGFLAARGIAVPHGAFLFVEPPQTSEVGPALNAAAIVNIAVYINVYWAANVFGGVLALVFIGLIGSVSVDCFLPGTPVNTRHGGSKPIEALEVGDEVLSYNEEDQRMEYNPVARLYRTRKSGYALINDTIKVTRAHPFLVNDRWTRVEDIRPGDRLADSDLRPVAVESIVWVPETTPVFNLTVGRAHTFFVHDRLVHNKPMPMPGGSAWNMGTPDTMM